MGKLKIYDADTQTGVECNKIVLCDANGNANYLNEIWFGDTKVWEYQPVTINWTWSPYGSNSGTWTEEGPCYLRWSGDTLQSKIRNSDTWVNHEVFPYWQYYYFSGKTSLDPSHLYAKETVSVSATRTAHTYSVSISNNASSILTLTSVPSTRTGGTVEVLKGDLRYPYVYGNSPYDWVDKATYRQILQPGDFTYWPSVDTEGAIAAYTILLSSFRQARDSEIYKHTPYISLASYPARKTTQEGKWDTQYGYITFEFWHGPGDTTYWYYWFKAYNHTGHPISLTYSYSGTLYTKTLAAGASSPNEWWIDDGATITATVNDVYPQPTNSIVYHNPSSYREWKDLYMGNGKYYSKVTVRTFSPCQVRLSWYNRSGETTFDVNTWDSSGSYYSATATLETSYDSALVPSGVNCTTLSSTPVTRYLDPAPGTSYSGYYWTLDQGTSSHSF